MKVYYNEYSSDDSQPAIIKPDFLSKMIENGDVTNWKTVLKSGKCNILELSLGNIPLYHPLDQGQGKNFFFLHLSFNYARMARFMSLNKVDLRPFASKQGEKREIIFSVGKIMSTNFL